MRARRLVADGQVERAGLVPAILAQRIDKVEEIVVAGDPAVGVVEAASNKVHAVGRSQGQSARVEQRSAFLRVDKLILHVDAAALSGVFLGRPAKAKVVPSIVRDVVGTARRVNLEQDEAAASVRDSDAEVVAADGSRPVGDTVGVDLAAQDTDGGGVLGVRSDADGLAPAEGAGRDGGSSGCEQSSE